MLVSAISDDTKAEIRMKRCKTLRSNKHSSRGNWKEHAPLHQVLTLLNDVRHVNQRKLFATGIGVF